MKVWGVAGYSAMSVAMAMAMALALGCGPAGGLPKEGHPVVEPEVPTDVDPAEASRDTLWPLIEGSRWVYRIESDTDGIFQKEVTVRGEEDIPGTNGGRGIVVTSVQPEREERSWQVFSNGVALRLREEDLRLGQLDQVMTWTPAVTKSLGAIVAPGFVHEEDVRELVRSAAGDVMDDKQKSFRWVVEAVESISTPAGDFPEALRVRRVRTDKPEWERLYWLVPGVGKVREEGPRTEILVEYVIPPAQ